MTNQTPRFELDGKYLTIFLPCKDRYSHDHTRRIKALISKSLIDRVDGDSWGIRQGNVLLRVPYDPNGSSVERQAEELFSRSEAALNKALEASKQTLRHLQVLFEIGELEFLIKHTHD